MVNLCVSLAVALFFVPAMAEKIRLKKRISRTRILRWFPLCPKRLIVWFNRFYGDKEQIAHVSGNQKDEEQQDKDGQAAAQVDFVQFGMDIFGGIVAAVYLVSGRKQATDFVHSLLNAFTETKLVSGFFGRERDVNRIQAVDAVIALRFLFATLHDRLSGYGRDAQHRRHSGMDAYHADVGQSKRCF